MNFIVSKMTNLYSFLSGISIYIATIKELRIIEDHKHTILPYTGFPCSSVSKESACSAGDLGLIPGLGRSPGEGNGTPL